MEKPAGKYQEKIDALEASIANLTKKAGTKEKCVSTLWIIGGAMPIVIGLGLWLVNPGFIQKKDGEEKQKDWTKFFMALGGGSLLAWGGLYAYSHYGGGGEVCAK